MNAPFEPREARLLNDYQRGLELVSEPFAAIACDLGTDETWVRATLARWQREGQVSRVGAVFRPGALGASTLAALAVPGHHVERVASVVSARPEVNHNYERDHVFNLWFVANARDAEGLADLLASIRQETGYAPISLPLVTEYWIDLGFDMQCMGRSRAGRAARARWRHTAAERSLSAESRRVLAALQHGLPLVRAPYAAIAAAAGVSEAYVLVLLADWLNRGVIKRLGVVVHHRALGYSANAMCVWNVPDDAVDTVGEALARHEDVTLCYRRRRAPQWQYNLYCMLHGHDRAAVNRRLAELVRLEGLDRFAHAVLFSTRAFKQRGAQYAWNPVQEPAAAA